MNFKYNRELKKKPYLSIAILVLIIIGCIFYKVIINHSPVYMDVLNSNLHPNKTYWFGTDSMGRDIYSMIWYGGRISLFIGVLATLISTIIGIVYGCISALSSYRIDDIMMKFIEIIISVPSILLIIFIRGMFKNEGCISISIAIGITSWTTLAKVVRTETMQIRNCDYVLYSKISGAGFFHILKKHLVPNFIATTMFIIISNIGQAILIESTLSFLGLGLPTDIVSWGSMLTLAQEALLTNRWWIILIPGIFLITTLVCINNIGNFIKEKFNENNY